MYEHYQSPLHNTILIKAIQHFVQDLHAKPFIEQQIDEITEEKLEMNQIVEATHVLAEAVSSLHEDSVGIHQEMIQMRETVSMQKQQTIQLKKSVEETVQALQASQINNEVFQTELASIKQAVSDFVTQSSTNGSFIWKISEVAQKLKDAREDRQTSIYSPAFYTSPTGYKMCLRLYFYGDGHARGTHISLFFVLMRGEYDAILQWPFPYKVTFCLYDQTGQQRHIIDSFRPDIKSNSFQRPRSNMNIASGIPKFLPLSMLEASNCSYIRDDCLFIRCVVELAIIPKPVIPFVFTINPGLPNHMQQSMIQAEIQKSQTLMNNVVRGDTIVTKDNQNV